MAQEEKQVNLESDLTEKRVKAACLGELAQFSLSRHKTLLNSQLSASLEFPARRVNAVSRVNLVLLVMHAMADPASLVVPVLQV